MANINSDIIEADVVTKYMKEEFPGYRMKSDYELFELAKSTFPNLEFQDSNPYSPQFSDTVTTSDVESGELANYSPDAFDSLLSFAVTDYGAGQESFLGGSSDFWKKSYNESAAGLAWALKHGKMKYNVDDYDPSVWAEIASFGVGLLSPVDLALFFGTGGIGAFGGKAVGTKILAKGVQKAGASKVAKKGMASTFSNYVTGKAARRQIYDAAFEGGFGLAAYQAAAGTLHEASKQSIEMTDYDYAKKHFGDMAVDRTEGSGNEGWDEWSMTKTAVGGAFEGLALGAVTGSTGAFIGRRFGKLRDAATAKDKLRKAQFYKFANLPTQVGVEGLEFTLMPYAIHGGPENFKQFQHDLIHNMGVIGTLKGSMGILKRGRADLASEAKAAVDNLATRTGQSRDKVVEKLKNEMETASDAIVLDEAVKENARIESKLKEQIIGFRETLELIDIAINKLENPEKLTKAERVKLAGDTIGSLYALRYFYQELGRNKEFAELYLGKNFRDTILEDGTIIPNAEYAALKVQWGQRLELIEEARIKRNDFRNMKNNATPKSTLQKINNEIDALNIEAKKLGFEDIQQMNKNIDRVEGNPEALKLLDRHSLLYKSVSELPQAELSQVKDSGIVSTEQKRRVDKGKSRSGHQKRGDDSITKEYNRLIEMPIDELIETGKQLYNFTDADILRIKEGGFKEKEKLIRNIQEISIELNDMNFAVHNSLRKQLGKNPYTEMSAKELYKETLDRFVDRNLYDRADTFPLDLRDEGKPVPYEKWIKSMDTTELSARRYMMLELVKLDEANANRKIKGKRSYEEMDSKEIEAELISRGDKSTDKMRGLSFSSQEFRSVMIENLAELDRKKVKKIGEVEAIEPTEEEIITPIDKEVITEEIISDIPKDIKNIKTVSHEEFMSSDHPLPGVPPENQNTRRHDMRPSSQFVDQFTPSNINSKSQQSAYNSNKAIVEYIIREVLPNRAGGAGGQKGKGEQYLSSAKMLEKTKYWIEMAEYFGKKGISFDKINREDLRIFLSEKSGPSGKLLGNAINDLKNYISNPTIKLMTENDILALLKPKKISKQGARKDEINLNNENSPAGNRTASIQVSKGGIIELPLTEMMAKQLESLYKRNKKGGLEFIGKDRDGNPYEFIFWREDGMPIIDKDLQKILSSKSVRDTIGRIIYPKNLRKSFITWTEKNAPEIHDIIQQIGLGHKTGMRNEKALRDNYKKITPEQWSDYRNAQEKFINEIFGKSTPEKTTGVPGAKDGFVSAWEWKQIITALSKEGQKIRVGNSVYDRDTVLALLQYSLETNLRGTDLLPNTQSLYKVGFLKGGTLTEAGLYTGGTSARPLKEMKTSDYRKLQREPLGEADLPSSISSLIERQLGLNPGLKLVVENNKSGKYSGYFDEIDGGIIKLASGRANIQTFFHENSHRFEAFIRHTGDKELIKLWERGEQMFSKEAKDAKQTANEFFTDRVSDHGTGMSKGIVNKISSWSKLMVSKLKQFLFGKSNLNKKDIARLLGEKVYKGFSTENIIFQGGVGSRKFQITDASKFAKSTMDNLDIILKRKLNLDKIPVRQRDKFISSIARIAEIDKPKQFAAIMKEIQKKGIKGFEEKEQILGDLEAFHSALSSADIGQIKAGINAVEWVSKFSKTNKARISFGMTDESVKLYLQALGLKSGNIYHASLEQLGKLDAYVKEVGVKTTNENWIQQSIKEYALDPETFEIIKRASEGKALRAPVQVVLETMGLNVLSNKLFKHASAEMAHLGEGPLKMEESASTLLATNGASNDSKTIGWTKLRKGRKEFEKIQDVLAPSLDKDRRKERLKLDLDPESGFTMPPKEKEFIESAFIKDKNGKITDKINENTTAGKVAIEVQKMNEYFKNELETVLETIMNPAEFEKFKKDKNINWIKDGIYVTRQLTEAFKQEYKPYSRALGKIIDKDADKLSYKLAKEWAKENKVKLSESELHEKSAEFLSVATGMAEAQMNDRFNFASGRFESSFLISRHDKLPEFWKTEDGRLIQVYETSYDASIRKYGIGMSKYLSNLEFFPEYAKLKGLHVPGVKSDLNKLKRVDSRWGTYVQSAVESQLGIGKKNVIYKKSQKILNYYANVIAKTQLSFPTSGLKNLLIGSYQTAWAFGAKKFFGGAVGAFNAEYRAEIRTKGHTEVGLRHLDRISGFHSKFLDKVFWFGAMRPTENINRYIAVLAGRMDQRELVSVLTNKKFEGTKAYQKAERRLRKFYKLSDSDIGLLKKFGMGGLDGNASITGMNRVGEIRKLNQVYQTMDSAAHIYTQGATLGLFMPKWAGQGPFKPLTLYKRMAYAATYNTMHNTRLAWQDGNYMKIVMGTLGAYMSGEALIAVYDQLLGQAPPHQNDDFFWERFATTMWKGEFMGIMSEWWNPDGGTQFESTLSPAIYNHAIVMWDVLRQSPTPIIGKKTRTGEQSLDKGFKSTFSVYNQSMKIWRKKMTPYNKGYEEYRQLYREFEAKLKPDETKESLMLSRTIKSPYFEDFKNIFNRGTDKEFAKQYITTFYAIANDYHREGMDEFGRPVRNMNEAFKYAESQMKNKLKGLNPNKGSYSKTGKVGLMRSDIFQQDYLNEKQRKELQKLETEYNFRIRRFEKNLPKYLKEFNLKELSSDFNWK